MSQRLPTPIRKKNAVVRALYADVDEAEHKALDSLSRYKFMQFGYWAAIWVHQNRISGLRRANPFRSLVKEAKRLKENVKQEV